MKLYLTPDDGYFHQCLDPLFRCVYRLEKDGYYKCPVCIFKFPSILLLGSGERNILRYDARLLACPGYEQLGRVASAHKDVVLKNIRANIVKVIDV